VVPGCVGCEGAAGSLAGPALFVPSSGALLGSSATNARPTPWGEGSFAELAAPSADVDAPPEPLLLVDGAVSLGALHAALEPILSRQQGGFRWVAGARPVAGPVLVTTLRIWRTLRVEIVPKLELRAAADKPEEAHVLAVRVDADGLATLALAGGRGFYRRVSGAEIRREAAPGPVAPVVSEVVVCVSGEMSAAEATALMLRLSPGRDVTYVVTTDPSPFG
jgi:hypothetical protein